jgi:hypothetical protein
VTRRSPVWVLVLVLGALFHCVSSHKEPAASPEPAAPPAAPFAQSKAVVEGTSAAPAATGSKPGAPGNVHREATAPSAAATPTAESAATPAAGSAAAPAEAEARATDASEFVSRREAARAEWDRARADLDAAASDCRLACRALDSMERAIVHLCALADEPDDRRRCDSAKKRLLDARDRVRAACGSCPTGPSLDRRAPVPSR